MASTHVRRYPPNTSEEYIAARNILLRAEWDLRDQIEKVAELRRQLPKGAVMEEYTFKEGPSDIKALGGIEQTTLAELGTDGRSVVVYHLMFGEKDEEPCGMCGLCVDSLNGVAKHLAQNVNFVVVAKAPIETLRSYAAKRGWDQIRILSSYESKFNIDIGVEKPSFFPEAYQMPGISVFKKDAKTQQLHHFYTNSAHFDRNTIRGLDLITPLWNVMDLTPEGRGNFNATNDYILQ